MRRSSYNNLVTLVALIVISAIYANAWANNGLYLDMEYYWGQYKYLQEQGITEAIIDTLLATGKLEIGIIYVYNLLDLLNVSSPFGFLFFMLLAIQGIMVVAIKKSSPGEIAPAFIAFALLSYYSFSQNTYFWRQILGISIAIYGVNQTRTPLKFILLVTACLFHYSSILIPPAWWTAKFISRNSIKSYFAIVPIIFFGTKYLSTLAESFSGSGTISILHEESSYDSVIYATIAISVLILLLYRTSYSKKFNNTVLVDFCLIFCILAIFGTGNQFIIRAFTPASLVIPYILALVGTPTAIILLIASSYTVVGLVFKITFLGLKVAT